MFTFAWPLVFILLPLPLVINRWLKPINREQSAVVVPFYQELININTHSIALKKVNRNFLKWLTLLLIWVLWLCAAARPSYVGEPVALSNSGRDLLVAIDISDSMSQTDMEINGESVSRLVAVKAVVDEFIQRRRGDRIGLILFGTNAYLQVPLTFDTKTVAQFLVETQLNFAGPRTAIGDAIGLSVKRLENLENNPNDKVIILLTDGANTAGEIEPLQAATLAKKTNIKIYTVGIGANRMTVRGFFGPRTINPSLQLDEETLITIAESTGGQYFRARDASELENIYKEIDKTEPIEQEQEWLRPSQSLFMYPLALALLLSVVMAIVSLYNTSSFRDFKKWTV